MKHTTLGSLPEKFTHLAKFRPSDLLDFGRRAKNMARMLHRPLQEMQEVLARAYGYAGTHELHQVLKVPGEPGPYQDQLANFVEQHDSLDYELRFYRYDRLMRFLIESRHEPVSSECHDLEVFACDLGLFSSPTSHRAAVKEVTNFLKSGKGFSLDGFPFGYNGVLHTRYRLCNLEIDELAVDALVATSGIPAYSRLAFRPSEQLWMVRRHRASHIFMEMLKRSSPAMSGKEAKIQIDWDWDSDAEVGALLQRNFHWEIQNHLRAGYESKFQVELDDDAPELVTLALAVLEPTDKHVNDCPLTKDITCFKERLAEWSLSLREQWATLFIRGEFDELLDIEGAPTLLTVEEEDAVMFIVMEEMETYSSFQRWSMTGTVVRRASPDGPWAPSGIFTGDYFIPESDGVYCPPSQVLDYFDDHGNSELYRAWQLLHTAYIPRAGYESYGDWVNDPEGAALVNIRYTVAEDGQKEALEALLLSSVVMSFQEGYSDSWDSNWKNFGLVNEQAIDEYDFDESAYAFPAIGVVFLPMPGTGILGYSIWAGEMEHATGQLLRAGGERLGRASRRYSFGTPQRTGRGWELLERVKDISADFVLYDPEAAAERPE